MRKQSIKKVTMFLAVMAMAVTALISNFNMRIVRADAHVPRIVAHVSLSGQTADSSSVAVITVPTGGADYRVSMLGVTTAGSPSGIGTIVYTDDNGSQTANVAAFSAITGKINQIHAASGSLTIATVGTQDGGSTTYNFYLAVEEL